MDYKNLLDQLLNSYDSFIEKKILNRRFKHSDLQPIIDDIASNDLFDVQTIGKSVEGREIKFIKIGSGQKKVLAWSQMHGDEATATMALFDLFNFMRKSEQYSDIINKIISDLTIYFIPMLNPDGAEVYKRRNALDVDLNRDAERLISPEAKILKKLRDEIEPDFGFNMHNQSHRYSVGKTNQQVAISFLSPSFNFEKDMNDVRSKTMQLIVDIKKQLDNYIDGHVAKYDDAFEPRAYGDNMIKWGTPTVLVETGGWLGDIEDEYLRKMNFVILLSGFLSICDDSYKSAKLEDYYAIPDNGNLMYDLILRNCSLKNNEREFTVDIGINTEEINSPDFKSFYIEGKIEDIGDLSTFNGLREIDCTGMEVSYGSSMMVEKSKNSLNQLPEVLDNKNNDNTNLEIGNYANLNFSKNGNHELKIVNGIVRN